VPLRPGWGFLRELRGWLEAETQKLRAKIKLAQRFR
jgi:hypothetical protein